MKRLRKVIFALVVGLMLLASVQPARAAETSVACTIGDVLASGIRMHIYCTNDLGGGIHYVAVPATDSDMSNRLLMMGTTAISSGKQLTVRFDPADLSGAAYGCSNTDCRPATAVLLQN